MFQCCGVCSFQLHLEPRWVKGSGTDPRLSPSRHHPSAVEINVKLHPFPTRQPSPFPLPTTLHISLAFQTSINVISSCGCLHYDDQTPSTPTSSPSSTALSFSFAFYLSAFLLANSAWILLSIFSIKKPHNWISYICLFLLFFSLPLPKTIAIRDARQEGEF